MKIQPAQALVAGAIADTLVVNMWLHGRSANTRSAYAGDVARFLSHSGKTITTTTLPDLQAWAQSMAGLADATRARRLAAVKSLLAFATRMGALQLNPGVALKIEKPSSTRGERILSQIDVSRAIAGETDVRRRLLLKLLYVGGLRASEACDASWRDMRGNERKGGHLEVLGKGGKLRRVGIPPDLWRELAALSPAAHPDARLVPGRDGDRLSRQAVHRAVKRAARRAGLGDQVSAHWLRHSHASHALDNGCQVHVLREQMGHADLKTTTGYLHLKPGESSSSFIKV